MLDHCGVYISGHSTLTNFILKNKNITHLLPTDLSNAKLEAKEGYHALAFLCGLNQKNIKVY